MKRNTNTRKIACSLFMLLIFTSHDTSAMENNYHKILQEIKELTTRIHREVDRVLADYRRDTAEYHRRMGIMRGQTRNDLLRFKEFPITRDGQVIATKIADTSPDSVSVSYAKEKRDAESPRRHILSLDGGGMRGILPTAVLAVIEQIINRPVNAQAPGKPKNCDHKEHLDLSDIFEVMTGTSTGSIIAATLLHANPAYHATDVLKLYVNYGYKIFDETARLAGGVLHAKYGSEGLENLLNLYTGGGNPKTLKESTKEGNHLYIMALNSKDNGGETVIFSNVTRSIISDSYIDHGSQPLIKVVMSSCAAPTFFPAVPMEIKGEKVLLVDGGVGANFPGNLAYKEQVLFYQDCHFDIISLGTGAEPADESNQGKNVAQEKGDDGIVAALPKLISELFAVATNKDIISCKNAVYDTSSRLQSFFRLQPLLEKGGIDILDNTTQPYALSLIHKAFQLTQGEVFKRMIESLGFIMPNKAEMKGIYKEILRQLYSFSSDDYSKLTDLEKELIAKKILELDFDFYENCNVNNIDLTEEQKMALFEQLVRDIEQTEENSGYLHRLKDWIYPDKNYKLIEIIKRSLDFHKYSKNINKLSLENLEEVIADSADSDETKIKQIFEAMLFEFKGSRSRQTIAAKAADYAYSWWSVSPDATVNGLCGASDTYQYSDHKAPYIDLVAAIYWKDKLSQIEDDMTGQQLTAFYKKMYFCFYGVPEDYHGIWNYVPKIYASRKDAFVTALGQYIKKRLLKEAEF